MRNTRLKLILALGAVTMLVLPGEARTEPDAAASDFTATIAEVPLGRLLAPTTAATLRFDAPAVTWTR